MDTKIYLDTSVPSAYYDDEKPERQELTKEFWLKIKDYRVNISDLVKDELDQIEDESLKRKMDELIRDFKILKTSDKVRELAEEYIKRGVVPEKFRNDAVHIAIATVNNMGALISWNFKHLVNIKTREEVNIINRNKGFKSIQIIAPPEL